MIITSKIHDESLHRTNLEFRQGKIKTTDIITVTVLSQVLYSAITTPNPIIKIEDIPNALEDVVASDCAFVFGDMAVDGLHQVRGAIARIKPKSSQDLPASRARHSRST